QQLDDFADAFRRGGRHGDDDLFQVQRFPFLQNHFWCAQHRHTVDLCSPLHSSSSKKATGSRPKPRLANRSFAKLAPTSPAPTIPTRRAKGLCPQWGARYRSRSRRKPNRMPAKPRNESRQSLKMIPRGGALAPPEASQTASIIAK